MGKFKKMLLVILGLALSLQTGWAKPRGFTASEQKHLVSLFEGEYPKAQLQTLFSNKKLHRRSVLVKRNIHTKETPRDYAGFTNSYSMHLAKKFGKKWNTTLNKAAKRFDVDREAVVAILLVETGFGNVMGKHPVIGVFSSILTERYNHRGRYPVASTESAEEVYYLNRLEKKAKWAKVELSALLAMSQKNNQSPYRYKGSYAGAFGLPQFLPSSYLKWGYDSDKNGSVNLFWFPDAIYSTANYLKKHGWKRGLHNKENHAAVFAYNHSTPYVNTILKIAKTLKHKKSARIKGTEVASRAVPPTIVAD